MILINPMRRLIQHCRKNSFVFATVIVGFSAAFFTWYPISDGDIFWHLAAGREIVRTHALPSIDVFSFTSNNFHWTDNHWLFQVLMYGVQLLLGMKGILVANSLFVGMAAALLFSGTVSPRMSWIAAALWIIAIFEVRYLAPHRPIMVSLLFLSLFLCCLDFYNRKRGLRYLIVLFPIQIIWANVQPLFILGPIVVGCWFAGAVVQTLLAGRTGKPTAHKLDLPLLLAVPMLCAASLVNPYGISIFKLALVLFHRIGPSHNNLFSSAIAENLPLFGLIRTPDAHLLWATLALTAIAIGIGLIRPKTLHLPLAVTALAMLFLAICAERNIILYFFAVLAFINANLPVASEPTNRTSPFILQSILFPAVILLSLLAGTSVVSHAAMLGHIRGCGPVAPFSFPQESIEYLTKHPLHGQTFNADRHGGFLLWKTYPANQVFIDTRYSLRPDSFLAEYCAISAEPALFDAVCKKYDITKAILPTALVNRYLKLSAALYRDKKWRLVVANGSEAMFVKSNANIPGLDLERAETVDSIANALACRWQASPFLEQEALDHFSFFLQSIGINRGHEMTSP